MKKKKSYMDRKNIISEGFYTKLFKMFLPKSVRKGLDKVKMDYIQRKAEIFQNQVETQRKKSEESFDDFLKELEKQTGKKVSKSQARKDLEKLMGK
mgnify:CR=1 FL=1